MSDGQVAVDKEAMRKFINLMSDVESGMTEINESQSSQMTRNTESSGEGAIRGGVKMTLGSVECRHYGRRAGEVMADRIAESVNAAVSIEEGARAMRQFAEEVLREVGNADEISSAELERMGESVGDSRGDKYGNTGFGLLSLYTNKD